MVWYNMKDKVICIYDEKGVSITEKILEVFEKFVLNKLDCKK